MYLILISQIIDTLFLIQVVLGGAEYSQVAPRKSYIDTRDFSSAKELAEYLIFLDNNEQERLRYVYSTLEFAKKYSSKFK